MIYLPKKVLPLAACVLGLGSFASADSLRSEIEAGNAVITKAMKELVTLDFVTSRTAKSRTSPKPSPR